MRDRGSGFRQVASPSSITHLEDVLDGENMEIGWPVGSYGVV